MFESIVFGCRLKNIAKVLGALFCLMYSVGAESYRWVTYRKLDSGVSEILMRLQKTDRLLLVICLDVGNCDGRPGIAYLHHKVFAQKLQDRIRENSALFGVECSASITSDCCTYSFYGNNSDIDNFLKVFVSVFFDPHYTLDSVMEAKRDVLQLLEQKYQIDKFAMERDIQLALIGSLNDELAATARDFDSIDEQDIEKFHRQYYVTQRLKFIVVSNIKSEVWDDKVLSYFPVPQDIAEAHKEKQSSEADSTKTDDAVVQDKPVIDIALPTKRMKPIYSDNHVHLERESTQANSASVELLWRVPSYYTNPEQALAAEFFVAHAERSLTQSLVHESNLATAVTITSSLWERDSGYVRILLMAKSQDELLKLEQEAVMAVTQLSTVGISNEELLKLSKEIISENNTRDMDIIDAVDWFSNRINYSFDFLSGYTEFVKQFSVDKLNGILLQLFNHRPNVTIIWRLKGEKNAD